MFLRRSAGPYPEGRKTRREKQRDSVFIVAEAPRGAVRGETEIGQVSAVAASHTQLSLSLSEQTIGVHTTEQMGSPGLAPHERLFWSLLRAGAAGEVSVYSLRHSNSFSSISDWFRPGLHLCAVAEKHPRLSLAITIPRRKLPSNPGGLEIRAEIDFGARNPELHSNVMGRPRNLKKSIGIGQDCNTVNFIITIKLVI